MSENQTNELPKTFSPQDIESDWYQTWENGKYFKPRKGKRDEAYCIIMPPPNVTGRLHAGHALDITTQDTMIRFKRMKGFEALFLPGMDHAGIATQNVVEKLIWEEGKQTKHDLGREKFLEKVWNWKEEYGGIIAKQQRTMGASPDWDYSLFTMDPKANEAVNHFFVELFNEGLIYQADYIVNWDPGLQSAISDAEVEHKDVDGNFYHLLYQIKDSDEKIEIATTRPETLLGDTAVCVNPEDDRFKHLIGKTAIVPICNREVPIVGDDYVDMELGTGCLKVTPGHDFNDFEIGKRHDLPTIIILNKDGTLNEHGLKYQGQSAKEARKNIVIDLKEAGICIDVKPHRHPVGHGDRSGAVIEPLVSKQWFLNVQKMAADAVEAVESDKTRFYPKQWENTYFSWLREPKNWCISRQLWWGHRIPVFYCQECNHQWAATDHPDSCPKCSKNNIKQDEDVLDTWFSSALWPMTTLGWPNEERMKEKGFDKFYPTSVLVTGFDIIFFWVARMMMSGIKMTGKIPFHHVYIHAIVRDKQGRKMSKSLGNGIDPLEMVDQYGADAFRFTLAAGSGYNRTLNLDPERINGYRNFINKIWNAFRFTFPFLDKAGDTISLEKLDHHEKWILSELNNTAKTMNESLEEYRYDDSCSAIYSFVYDKFCSWFVELSKNVLHGDYEDKARQRATVIRYGFKEMMKLIHPIAPYISEEIWKYLKADSDDLIIIQEYPEFDEKFVFEEDQKQMQQFIETITSIRNLRSSIGVKPKDEVKTHIFVNEDNLKEYFDSHSNGFLELAKSKTQFSSFDSERPKKCIMQATGFCEIYMELDGLIDVNEHLEKLKKDQKKLEKEVSKFNGKLSNKKFVDNAPEEVIIETKEKLATAEQKLNSTVKMIEELS